MVPASVATGAAGPVDFVALAGALIVVLADLPARRLFWPVELPVGVLTAAVGAP